MSLFCRPSRVLGQQGVGLDELYPAAGCAFVQLFACDGAALRMTADDDHARALLGKPCRGLKADPGGAAQHHDAAIENPVGCHTRHAPRNDCSEVAFTPARPASFFSKNCCDRCSTAGVPPHSAYPNRHSTLSCSSRVRPMTSKIVSLADSTARRSLRRMRATMSSAAAINWSWGTTLLTMFAAR